MTEISIGNLDALQLTQTARAQQSEVESVAPEAGSTLRLGPIATDLQSIDPRLVTVIDRVIGVDENGEPITVSTVLVDTTNVAGLAWAAAAVAGDQIAALTLRVAALESQLAEFL